MSDVLLRRLKEAREAGEILTVVYLGGSQPGTKRELLPLSVSPQYMLATDFLTHVKTYRLDRLQIVDRNHPAPLYVPGLIPEDRFSSLAEVEAFFAPQLVELGYNCALSDASLTVHGRFKNGKLRKAVIVGITHGDGPRPWAVDGRTYGTLDRAIERFEIVLGEQINWSPKLPPAPRRRVSTTALADETAPPPPEVGSSEKARAPRHGRSTFWNAVMRFLRWP